MLTSAYSQGISLENWFLLAHPYLTPMVDEHGPTREDYMVDLERLLGTRYIQTIAATLIVCDFINLIPRQVQHLYRHKWSKLHTIYFSILISSWTSMIAELYSISK